MWRSSSRPGTNRPARIAFRSVSWHSRGGGTAQMSSCGSLLLPAEPQIADRNYCQGQQEQNGSCRAFTKTEEAKREIIDVDRQHGRRIHWAAVSHDIHYVEDFERVDDAQQQNAQRDRA